MRNLLFFLFLLGAMPAIAQTDPRPAMYAGGGDIAPTTATTPASTPTADDNGKSLTDGATDTGHVLQPVQNGRVFTIWQDRHGERFIVVKRPRGWKRVYYDAD